MENLCGKFGAALRLQPDTLATLFQEMVFAEAGKQNAASLSGFVTIQIAFSAVQTILVTLVFVLVSFF